MIQSGYLRKLLADYKNKSEITTHTQELKPDNIVVNKAKRKKRKTIK